MSETLDRVIDNLNKLEESLRFTYRYALFQEIKKDLLDCIEELYTFQAEFLGHKNVEFIDEETAFEIIGALRKWLRDE